MQNGRPLSMVCPVITLLTDLISLGFGELADAAAEEYL
jgi:hypothetical protein